MSLFAKALNFGSQNHLRRIRKIADQVNAFEKDVAELSDAGLRWATTRFRDRLAAGETLDDILPEAYAVVREASKRVLGMRHYDVQIIGGIALHQGHIAELKTGEGKTLTATLPAYLNALTGKGVHVVTVNDYLAARDAEIVWPLFDFLGLTVGVLTSELEEAAERREQYNCDITYGTNVQFGFDYLRDNMVMKFESKMQRGYNFAIVDEVDSILIDEARTPMVISGPAELSYDMYETFNRIVDPMIIGVHYEVDEKIGGASLTEDGITAVEQALGIDNLYDIENSNLLVDVKNAVQAKALFRRDRDYVVQDDKVILIDSQTGRLMPSRRLSNGQHQAIEAKEGVSIHPENQTYASASLQNYFLMYDKLAGMTGTASTSAGEFWNVYKLEVIVVPTHKEMRRVDQPDLVYLNTRGKFNAVVREVIARHETGQPVLVGTTSVEKSEYLANLLREQGVEVQVLNAKNHELEAAIVGEAGRLGRVTIATNMAGRGTDILLGGDPRRRASELMEAKNVDPEDDEAYAVAWDAAVTEAREACAKEAEQVRAAGGLYVLGTERNEARRVDDQLRGRAGRQGDPGESRFFLALDDDMMRIYQSNSIEKILEIVDVSEDVPIKLKKVVKSFATAQAEIEGANAKQRAGTKVYDDVMDKQRHQIYGQRDRVLQANEKDIWQLFDESLDEALAARLNKFAPERRGETWDLDAVWTSLEEVHSIDALPDDVIEAAGGLEKVTAEDIHAVVSSSWRDAAREKVGEVDPKWREFVLRIGVLNPIDVMWRYHLLEIDYLKSGIGMRAMAGKNPQIEYALEAYDYFTDMVGMIRDGIVRAILTVKASKPKPEEAEVKDIAYE